MTAEYIDIPYQQLSSDVLQALIEEFICREGTDYGEVEFTLSEKANQLLARLQEGKAVIVFDPATETCSFQCKEVL